MPNRTEGYWTSRLSQFRSCSLVLWLVTCPSSLASGDSSLTDGVSMSIKCKCYNAHFMIYSCMYMRVKQIKEIYIYIFFDQHKTYKFVSFYFFVFPFQNTRLGHDKISTYITVARITFIWNKIACEHNHIITGTHCNLQSKLRKLKMRTKQRWTAQGKNDIWWPLR